MHRSAGRPTCSSRPRRARARGPPPPPMPRRSCPLHEDLGTRMRGLSEAYGSWKMICIRGARGAARSPLQARQVACPSKRTLAARSAGISRRMALPAVVLPQPDSPTSASVRPARDGERNAVDRLDMADHALEQARADRKMHFQVAHLRAACRRPLGDVGLPRAAALPRARVPQGCTVSREMAAHAMLPAAGTVSRDVDSRQQLPGANRSGRRSGSR